MNDEDFIENINCHGYALYSTRVIPEQIDISSIDAYLFLDALEKIEEPEPGCIIAFRTPKIIERKPWYRHSGRVIYVNPVWIFHKEDIGKKIKGNTLDQLKNSRNYKGDKIFYFKPKPLWERFYSYMKIRNRI